MINQIVVEGNLTKDTQLKEIKNGAFIIEGVVAINESKYENGEWVNMPPSFIKFSLFTKIDKPEYHIEKGARVIIAGKIRKRIWKDKDGNSRNDCNIIANNIYKIERNKPIDGMETDVIDLPETPDDDGIPF